MSSSSSSPSPASTTSAPSAKRASAEWRGSVLPVPLASPSLHSLRDDSTASPRSVSPSPRGPSPSAGVFSPQVLTDGNGDALPQLPRTKIICTIGPASDNDKTLASLMASGMSVVRLNFSHADHERHASTIRRVRQVMRESKRIVAIMLDTKGPEIRTGLLKGGRNVQLVTGQEFTLRTGGDGSELGDDTHVYVTYANLPRVIAVGKRVLIDDGLIELEVLEVGERDVRCKVLNNGELGQQKGVNLPGTDVDMPAVTQQDVLDIKFGAEQQVDIVAASFVRQASDVLTVRQLLGPARAAKTLIIAKIENRQGLDNFDEILAVADGIMVARGDLGVEIDYETVALAQKMMIRKANAAGKPIITATQMLESMVKKPTPTRAEVSDVANAVYDGSDAVMLSGETAKGRYPVEAVRMMADICRESEASVFGFGRRVEPHRVAGALEIAESIAAAAASTARDVGATLIICLTQSGTTARLVAKYRPDVSIVTVTCEEYVAAHMLLLRSCFPLLVGSMTGTDSLVDRITRTLHKLNMCKAGDRIVVTRGAKEMEQGGTNILRVVTVPEYA